MATLTNQQINLTYPSLIKFDDNLGVQPTTAKQLTDGVGGSLPISVSQVQTVFQTGSIVDFTGTTVNGLPIQPAGLVNGTGSGSLRASDSLLDDNATAAGNQAVALGNATSCNGSGAVAIGNGSSCDSGESVSIGKSCQVQNGPGVAIGRSSFASGSVTTAIGNSATVTADQSIGISGENVTVQGSRSIAIGRQAFIGSGSNNIALGNFAKINGSTTGTILLNSSIVGTSAVNSSSSFIATPGNYGGLTPSGATHCIVIGSATSALERAQAADTISIGRDTQASNVDSIAFGRNTSTLADGAVALGAGVQATRSNTVSVNALEVKNNTDGIILYSPDNTAYRVTVANGGTLTVTAV